MSALVRRLRAERFDLSVDCRMDLRSNALTRSIGAARRIGYDFGGGGFLLTDRVPAPPADQHKVDDWLGLLAALAAEGGVDVPPAEPELTVSEQERVEARRLLETYDVGDEDVIVGVHPGGSYESKRWAPDNFAAVTRRLSERYGARVLVFVDPDGYGADMHACRR
jgi:ADP-heptose:LPS heptosyltransferase